MFQALLETRLVESGNTCEYLRDGRSYFGVSAFEQIVRLGARSSIVSRSNRSRELDYLRASSRSLLCGTRVLTRAPVPDGSSTIARV